MWLRQPRCVCRLAAEQIAGYPPGRQGGAILPRAEVALHLAACHRLQRPLQAARPFCHNADVWQNDQGALEHLDNAHDLVTVVLRWTYMRMLRHF